MGNLEKIVKAEILRLANREIRRVFRPLKKELWAMRGKLSTLSKSVASLNRIAKEKWREPEAGKLQNLDLEEAKKSRFTPGRIRGLRLKLGLSQRELAKLTGVTLGAVGFWEKGKFAPKLDKKAILLALRKMGKRGVRKMLMDMERGTVQEKKAPSVKANARIKRPGARKP